MKLKNKLLPLLSVCGVSAVIAPIGLTSCGGWVNYTDILNKEYVPGVTPYKETKVYGEDALSALYTNRANQNFDIIRDDMLYTWSKILHDPTAKAEVEKKITYSKFIFDLHPYTRQEVVVQGQTVMETTVGIIDMESYVVGKNISIDNLKYENKKIENFDFHFNVQIHGIQTIQCTSSQMTRTPDCFKDLYPTTINFGQAFVETTVDGTYTFVGENETHTFDNVSEYSEPKNVEGEDAAPIYSLFGFTTLALHTLATPDPTMNGVYASTPLFTYASHYLKNIKLVMPEAQ